MSTEQKIRENFNCAFEQKDWKLFKMGADYYLKKAATLKKRDISKQETFVDNSKKDVRLLFRNNQKRLFIGIGCEFLVKSYYLKSGFYINRIEQKNDKGSNAFLFSEIDRQDTDNHETITMNHLIQGLAELERKKQKKPKIKIEQEIRTSLEIAKVFRNKEAHIITKWHTYNSTDYDVIEAGIKLIYKNWFNEDLEFQISFEYNEKGQFKIENAK